MSRTLHIIYRVKNLMVSSVVRGVAVVLMVAALAPSLLLSVAPREAHAQVNVGGAAVSAATCLVSQLLGGFLGAAGGVVGAVASALAVPVNDTAANAYLTSISTSAGSTAGSTWQDLVKECVLDPLVWSLKDMIIQQMMQDVLGWINGGFDGTPGFIQDPAQWFGDLGKNFLNEVLVQSGVTELCEPFRMDVQFSMYLDLMTPTYNSQVGNGAARCNLDDYLNGVSFDVAVEQGDANQAGVAGMFGVQMENNNPVSSYLSLQKDLADRFKTNIEDPNKAMLAYGNGFFSMKCDGDGDPSNGNESTCTPGKFIQEQITAHASGPMQELVAADEFSEIINALIAAFVREVLNDQNGLLGRSSNQQYWNGARSTQPSAQDWCTQYPNANGCNPSGVSPTPPPSNTASGTQNTPAQIAELDQYKSDLMVAVTALMMNLSTRGAVVRNQYTPTVLQIQSNLARVDITLETAYGDLNDIRTRILAVLRALGINNIPLPPPLADPLGGPLIGPIGIGPIGIGPIGPGLIP